MAAREKTHLAPLKKPAIAFLDEENERFLYEKLCASGIAFVSVGHRSTLKEFHDRLLMLKNDGTSESVPLPKAAQRFKRAIPDVARSCVRLLCRRSASERSAFPFFLCAEATGNRSGSDS